MPGSGSLCDTKIVNVGVGATVLAAANADRMAVVIRNIGFSGGVDVFVGGIAVTIANGTPLDKGPDVDKRGDTLTIPGTCAVSAIVAAGTQDVSVMEIRD